MGKTEAQRKGQSCERRIGDRLKLKCPILIRLPKGADFMCINENISFHEAKSKKSNLTPYEREFRRAVEALGFPYNIERCE